MVQSTKPSFHVQGVKVCTRCGETKSLTEFYKSYHTRDGRESWCKHCKKVYSAIYRTGVPVAQAFEPSTLLGADILARRGIPTTTGNGGGLPYIDLVAWGCVPIEVKTSLLRKGGAYSWVFSKKQRENGVLGFLMLIGDPSGAQETYIVPTSAPWLYTDGKLPPRISFVSGKRRPELDDYQDAFDQLRTAQTEYEAALVKSSGNRIDFLRAYWTAKLPGNNL